MFVSDFSIRFTMTNCFFGKKSQSYRRFLLPLAVSCLSLSFSSGALAKSQIFAWGSDTFGALGNGAPNVNSALPVDVLQPDGLSARRVIQVSGGWLQSLALCSDGTVWAWGNDGNGELGNGQPIADSSVPVQVDLSILNGKKVVQIASGGYHNIALCSDGTLVGWGYNVYTSSSTGDSSSPRIIERGPALEGKTIVQIVAGEFHQHALCSDGTVVSWGQNSSAQLGNPVYISGASSPTEIDRTNIPPDKKIVRLATRHQSTLALCSDGTVIGWGLNGAQQLGFTGSAFVFFPQVLNFGPLAEGQKVAQIASGYDYSLLLLEDGTLLSCGSDQYGQLGDGAGNVNSGTAVEVVASGALSGKTVSKISAGAYFGLVLCSDGTLVSWGHDNRGQLGDDAEFANKNAPVFVSSFSIPTGQTVQNIGSGFMHGLAFSAAPNSAPVGQDLQLTTTRNVTVAGALQVSDADDEPLSFSISTSPQNGRAQIAADGTVRYIPNRDFVGEDELTVEVSDGISSAPLRVLVSVEESSNAPRIVTNSRLSSFRSATNQFAPLSVEVQDLDGINDVASVEITGQPVNVPRSGNRIENAKKLTLRVRYNADSEQLFEEGGFVVSRYDSQIRRFVDLPSSNGVVKAGNFTFDLTQSRVEKNESDNTKAQMILSVASETTNTWSLSARATDKTERSSQDTRFGVWSVSASSSLKRF